MNKEELKNKKYNIILSFIKLIIALILFDFLSTKIYQLIARSIIYGRYQKEIIAETILIVVVLILLIVLKKSYIFKENKKSFIKSIKIGGAMFFLSLGMLVTNISVIPDTTIYNILSLIIYCLAIGFYEELLCRGWLQNSLIEHYSSTQKQVITSIFLSAIIFGFLHITNIWIGGQSILETITQIIQATGMGVYLGAIYYRTKNIYANAFLHGFWDFAILVGEINTIKSCSDGNPTKSYQISLLISSVILCIIYILIGLYLLRKSKLTEQFSYSEEQIKLSEIRKGRIIFIIAILYLLLPYIIKENNQKICYTYEEKEVIYTETISPNYTEYYFNDNDTNYKLYLKDNILSLKNTTNNYEKSFSNNQIQKFMVVKDHNQYHILIIGYNEYKTSNILYYSLIDTNNINNENTFIDNFMDSFTTIDSAPTLQNLGYFYSYLDNITYPYVVSYNNDTLILYNKELFKIKLLNYESFIENNLLEEKILENNNESFIEDDLNPIEE